MSEEQISHPNMDVLGISGKMIGLHPDPSKRYAIECFSYPASIEVWDQESLEKVMRVGYVCIYIVKFNFKYAGRKVVKHKLSNLDAGETPQERARAEKMVVGFLEHTAEELLAHHIEDVLLKWDEPNTNDNKA
jgi:hypothetical protein